MNYYCKELTVNENAINTAGIKARDDIDTILDAIGFHALPVYYHNVKTEKNKFVKQLRIFHSLKEGFSPLRKGDVLLVQFPLVMTTGLFGVLLHDLLRRDIRIIALVHDLETLRTGKIASTGMLKKLKHRAAEWGMLSKADCVIVHNPYMLRSLSALGLDETRMVSLELFDYMIPDFNGEKRSGKTGKDKPVIIAGNLRPHKSGYAYHLPSNSRFNLYGIDFSGELPEGSQYFGAFPPDEIPFVMDGSFGLVWDGESVETCTGVFGEYMKLNCPHKTSLYLAAGIPVAIWKEAALADFILRNKVGIAVASLHDLHDTIDRLSNEEYAEMVKNAEAIGARLRAGYYTRKAVAACRAAEGDSRT